MTDSSNSQLGVRKLTRKSEPAETNFILAARNFFALRMDGFAHSADPIHHRARGKFAPFVA